MIDRCGEWFEEGRGEAPFLQPVHRESPVDEEVEASCLIWSRTRIHPPQFHHNCVTVHGVRWRFTAVGDFQKPLRLGPWCSMAVNRRFRDRSENHGAPGSNPGPAT
jgi:hypothetical protein